MTSLEEQLEIPPVLIDPESPARDMYASMVRIRVFEERVADAITAGLVKTPCHLCIGQEGVAVGACFALDREDYAWITYRSHGQFLAKGGSMDELMAEILGKATGCAHGRGGSMHVVDPSIGVLGTSAMVAGPIPMGVGTALASTLRGDGRVSVVFFGDGATDEGVFWEAVNMASLNRLPVVFVCENNQFASAMHILDRQPRDNIHERVAAFAVNTEVVDGNDVGAVHRAVGGAVARARDGQGPAFIECKTYRWRGHVGPNWDLDKGIRSQEQLDWWMARDPIKRWGQALLDAGICTEDEIEAMWDEIRAEVSRAFAFAEQSPYPDVATLESGPGGA